MTTQLMAPETAATSPAASREPKNKAHGSQPVGLSGEPSVQQLIASARHKRKLAPAKGAWIAGGLTGVLFWSAFMPLDFSPLAWIALVPLLMLVRIPQRTAWMYFALTITGIATMIACLQWMRLGDVTMYPAWFLLASYCGLYFPVFVGLTRVAVHRLRVPFTLAVPVVWTGLEYARAILLTGFAWYYLAHTQYRWLELIQVSDLVGAYGVSFLIAMASAVIAGLIPRRVFERLRLVPADVDASQTMDDRISRKNIMAVCSCLALFAAVLTYGYIRRSQAEFTAGPRVALIQGNFISSVKHDPREALRIFNKHVELTTLATEHQPEFIVWPETMHRDPLIAVKPNTSDAELRAVTGYDPEKIRKREERITALLAAMSKDRRAAMIVGLETLEVGADGQKHYNSAAFSVPQGDDGRFAGRYDKIHRVPFGEFVPFKEQFPLLLKVTPFPEGFGVDAGEAPTYFTYNGYRCAPIICFEDTVPHLVREIVKQSADGNKDGRPVDFLMNLTNDGWFHGSAELDQHLITAVFRSVECRTPTVRAVNTGISAFIDGDGAVIEPEVFIDGDGGDRTSMRDGNGRWNKSLNAALVHNVPLDNRASLYVQWGDWFAGSFAAFAAFLIIAGLYFRRADRRNAGRELYDAAVKSA